MKVRFIGGTAVGCQTHEILIINRAHPWHQSLPLGFFVMLLEYTESGSVIIQSKATSLLLRSSTAKACLAVPLLWITGVQFVLHFCDPFLADSGLKPAFSWHHKADPGSGKIVTIESGPQRAAGSLRWPLPHPSKDTGSSGSCENWAISGVWSLSSQC